VGKLDYSGDEHGAMIKKKTKSKTAAKKEAKKKSSSKIKKQLNPAEVRNDISEMVESEAREMAQAVIGEGKKGQLAMVKYLFEMARIFPEATDGSQASAEEDCLARTLLNRMDLPEEPIGRDEEDERKPATPTANAATKAPVKADKDAAKDSGSESESGEQSKEPVVM
jgi:hypothetical protein